MKRFLLAIASFFALVMVVSCGALSTPTSTGQANYSDQYIGYKIYRPSGWTVSSTSGVIIVKEDSKATTAALVYPTSLEANLSAEAFLRAYFSTHSNITGITSLSNLNVSATDANIASATFSGTISGSQVQGIITVDKEQKSNRVIAIYKSYWSTDFSANKDTLKSIVDNYSELNIYEVSLMEYETQGGISMAHPKNWIMGVSTYGGQSISVVTAESGINPEGTTGVAQVQKFTDYFDPNDFYNEIKNWLISGEAVTSWTDDTFTYFATPAQYQTNGARVKSIFEIPGKSRKVEAYITIYTVFQANSKTMGIFSIKQAPQGELDDIVSVLNMIEESPIVLDQALLLSMTPFIRLSVPTLDFSSSAQYNSEVREKTFDQWDAYIREVTPTTDSSGKRREVPRSQDGMRDSNGNYPNPDNPSDPFNDPLKPIY